MISLGLVLLGLAASPLAIARNVSNVLIYSATAGYRHDSIPTAVAEMTRRGPDYGINFDNTEDMTKFNDDYLSQFDAVFFLSNTDEVLNAAGKVAFQKYLDAGGNFVGAHAATNCMQNWTTMEGTMGSRFQYHPDFTNATMLVLDASHPSTAGLPPRWKVTDEIYSFTQDPRELGAVVVLAADETSYNDGARGSSAQGDPHPIAWYQAHHKGSNSTTVGRSWYTGLGHASAAWKNDVFMSHIFGGITYVLDSGTTRATNPDATVGSLGPSYSDPSPEPTATVDVDGHSSATRASHGLSLVGSSLVLMALWVLHVL